MLSLRPARRSPRVMAIVPSQRGVAFAVVDPWDVRAIGTVGGRSTRARAIAFDATLTRERPSVIVVRRRERSAHTRAASILASRRGLDAIVGPPEADLHAYRATLPTLCP